MLFMVIERFKAGNANAIGERFQKTGRMLPDGVTYLQSWVDVPGTCCFQLMEAGAQDALDPWIKHWSDLVDFTIYPVLSSAEFWPRRSKT
jgi:hypothetical protein